MTDPGRCETCGQTAPCGRCIPARVPSWAAGVEVGYDPADWPDPKWEAACAQMQELHERTDHERLLGQVGSIPTTTDWEDSRIAELDGVVAHESAGIHIDPEDGARWALCWVRMPRTH